MDDDDNDDAQNDQKEDDEDDISFNTYSKKKYFGKITKDLKSTYKINYRPRA